jgi:hypothetical protein
MATELRLAFAEVLGMLLEMADDNLRFLTWRLPKNGA